MAVTNNATLVEDHETAPTYTSIGSGQGAGSESNFFFRGVLSSSRKMSGVTKAGFWFTDGTQHDVSASAMHVKMFINAITQAAFTDFWIRIGSGQTSYEEHNVGVGFYDNDAGGWIPVWVEVDGGVDTGTPVFTAVDEWAVICSMGTISGNVKNFITDQTHYSTRPVLTWDGTGGDLDDFITTELSAGVGALKLLNGLYTCFANLQIGSATSTTFDMAGETVAFPDATWLPSASIWMGLDFDLSHASTVITATGGSVISGNPAGASARKPDIIVTGTSGALDFSGRSFDGMRIVTFTTGVTAKNCAFANCGAIDAVGADLAGSSVLTPTVAANTSGLIWNTNTDPAGELDDMTFSKTSGVAHHAIEFGLNVPTTSMTLNNCAFGTDFSATEDGSVGDETFHFLDTTGTITLNLVGCTGNFGYRTEGVVVTIVADPATTKITAEEADGTPIENARVFLETADNGGGSGFPYQAATSSLTQASGTATLTASAVHGLATGDKVVVRGAAEEPYNSVVAITVTSTTVFTYPIDSGATSPAGGTPIFSYVPIQGLTDSNGEISSSKVWPASQGLIGWARKSSAAPFFKQTAISIADASGGTDLLVALQPDE